jgi:hypothetical protein
MNFLKGLGTTIVAFLALIGAIFFFFVTCLVMSSLPGGSPWRRTGLHEQVEERGQQVRADARPGEATCFPTKALTQTIRVTRGPEGRQIGGLVCTGAAAPSLLHGIVLAALAGLVRQSHLNL